jgi:hypothetical protein
MTNDVAPAKPSLPPALVQKIAEGLARAYGGTDHAQRLGLPLLKMNKNDGSWSFGVENNEVQPGAHLLVDTGSFKHGLVVWSDSKIVHEEMVEGWEAPPPIPLQPHPTGQPYKRQSQVKLRILDGEDEGLELLYKISSDGGNERLAELGRQAGARIGLYAETSPYLYPVIQLDSDWYKNKNHGSNTYKPIFRLVGWADAEGNLEDAADKVVELPKQDAGREPPVRPAKPPLNAEMPVGQRRRPGR